MLGLSILLCTPSVRRISSEKMRSVLLSKWQRFLLQNAVSTQKSQCFSCFYYSTMLPASLMPELQELCTIVSSAIGGLDDLESSLNEFSASLTSSLVTQVIDSCKSEAPTRRLLRFFSWCHKNLGYGLQDKDYNYGIRVFAEKKDHTAMNIVLSDLVKAGRVMEAQTFGLVTEALVKLGKEDEALGMFKNLDKYKCPQDGVTVTAIVNALCSQGHAKRAEGVVLHHRDKIAGIEPCIYKSLLYGWSVQENVKEARRIIKEMKSIGIMPDLFCYNTFLRGLCERNLKLNPSGLVPEALNVMIEMRSYRISPNSISYNILLSCLGRTRRVKESCNILETMKKTGCSPDCVSYYLVVRVLYLSGRFGKGNKMVDEMLEQGLQPNRKFYYDLIGVLVGKDRPRYALELLQRMKASALGGYGPVYDVLIPKFCREGDFEKGRELWDEAVAMGVTLRCSSNLLDPSITEVFRPTRNEEKLRLIECANAKAEEKVRRRTGKTKQTKKKKKILRRMLKKKMKKKKKSAAT